MPADVPLHILVNRLAVPRQRLTLPALALPEELYGIVALIPNLPVLLPVGRGWDEGSLSHSISREI